VLLWIVCLRSQRKTEGTKWSVFIDHNSEHDLIFFLKNKTLFWLVVPGPVLGHGRDRCFLLGRGGGLWLAVIQLSLNKVN